MSLKIGELAKKTNISVRTLHHYDEIGLLKPSNRTESGHRVYNKDDISRLHRILTLRQLNLSLDEIRNMVGEPIDSIRETFDRHREALEVEIEERKKKLKSLENISVYLDLKEGADISDIVSAIKEFELHDLYYSKEQLDLLSEKEKELGRDKMKEIINEWPVLIQKARLEMEKGTEPSDEKVKAIAKRWQELADLFVGDDAAEIVETTQKMYHENSQVWEHYGVNPEVLKYIREAKQYL